MQRFALRKWSYYTAFAVAGVGCGAILACGDEVTAPPRLAAHGLDVADGMPGIRYSVIARTPGHVSKDEALAGEELARALAITIGDRGAARLLFGALASSRVRERKLHLASYIEGRGGPLLALIARRTGLSESDVASLSSRLRDLELYMPVADHRARWTGDEPVLVAIPLDENEDVVAFDAEGRRRVFRKEVPPTEYVIVLAPVETDFDNQVALNRAGRAERRCEWRVGRSLEDVASACDQQAASRGPVRALIPTTDVNPGAEGLFLTFSRITEDCGAECWAWGNPEYEYFVFGKRNASDTFLSPLQCTAEAGHYDSPNQPGNKSSLYEYDQQDRFWERAQGSMLLNRAQIDQVMASDSGRIVIALVEDDTDACRLKGLPNVANILVSDLEASGHVAGNRLSIQASSGGGTSNASMWLDAVTLGASLITIFSTIHGDDDFVGWAIDKSSTQWASEYPNNTHILMRGSRFTGRITLKGYLTGSTLPSPPGASASIELSSDSISMASGASRTVQVMHYDASGRPTSYGTSVSWTSRNPSIASVNAYGVVSAGTAGAAWVVGTNSSGATDSVHVKSIALGAVSHLVIDAPAHVPTGTSVSVAVRAYDSNGFELPVYAAYLLPESNGILGFTGGASGTLTATAQGFAYLYAIGDEVRDSVLIDTRTLDVTLTGPTTITHDTECRWEAVAFGGTPPYTVSIFLNETDINNGASWFELEGTLYAPSFWVSAWVSDANGATLQKHLGTITYDTYGYCRSLPKW